MTILAGRFFGPMLALALLTACSSNLREVLGEPPQVSLSGLEKHADRVTVELAVRNVNDEPLLLNRAAVELVLDGQPLAAGKRDMALTVSARGREVIRLPLPAEPEGLEALQRLADAQAGRLRWTLQARLVLGSGRERVTDAEGWLYPVPGQPDRFR
ncbi:MAG: LEA type 2 family protein [Xanthomonadales bacterium]|nr:LEA type 2 family protein [Xanthomonadales bacterium]